MLNKIKQKYNSKGYEPLKDMLATTVILSFGAYCIPSVYKSIKEVSNSSLDTKFRCVSYDKYDDEVYTFGMTFGLAGFGSQAYLYSQNPQFLIIPILTNIFSGIYEYRKIMNKKTINKKILEDKLELY